MNKHVFTLKKYNYAKEIICYTLLLILSFCTCWHLPFAGLAGDVGDYAYGVYASMAHAWFNGEYPFWNPNLMCGMPNTAITSSQMFYPITIIVCHVFYNPDTNYLSPQILNALMSIHLGIFACSVYYLLRKLNIRKSIAFTVSVLVSSSGMLYFVMHWTALFSGYAYLPLMWAMSMQFMEHIKSKKRWVYCALNGLVIGLIGLSCASHSLLFALLLYAILYITYVWKYRKAKEEIKNLTKCAVTSGLIGGLISLPVLLPFIDFLNKSYRFVSDGNIQGMEQMSYYAFTEASIDNTGFTGILGTNIGGMGCGIALSILIYSSFFIKRKFKSTVFYAAQFTFVFSLFYSISFAFTEIFYYFPFYNQIREPFLYVPLIALAGGILAGITLESIFQSKVPSKVFNNLFILVFGLGTIILINLLPKNVSAYGCFIVVLIVVGYCILKYKDLKFKKIILNSILCLICITSVAQSFLALGRYGLLGKTEKISLAVDSAKAIWENDLPDVNNLYRIMTWSQVDCYPRNVAAALDYYDTFGYLNPIYATVMNMHINWNIDKQVALKNVRYLIASESDNETFLQWINDMGFKEYKRIQIAYKNYDTESTDSLILFTLDKYGSSGSSYAWMVYEYDEYDNTIPIETLNEKINSEDFLPQSKALVNGVLKYENDYDKNSSNDVVIEEYNANSVSLSVDSESAGILVTSDIYDDGWNVYVDGSKQSILEVNTTFRGVELPEGHHKILFKYEPLKVYVGIVSALGGVIVALILMIYAYKADRKYSTIVMNSSTL